LRSILKTSALPVQSCLVTGIIAAVYWLFHLMKTVPGEYLPYTKVYLADKKELDPIALGLAFASAFQGK
jgi:hypothetical protein